MKECELCGKQLNTDNPHIYSEELNVWVHVSCMFTASPSELLRMLKIDVAFYFMTGNRAISMADMYAGNLSEDT